MEEKENKQTAKFDNPSQVEGGNIDFSSVKALANSDWKKEPWIKRFGIGLAETLIKLLLFVLGIVLDVIKAVVQIVVFVVSILFKGGKKFGLFLRKQARMFREVDGLGKLNWLFMGAGYLKAKQYFNAIVFFSVEVLFIVYMILVGGPGIHNFIFLGNESRGLPADPNGGGLTYYQSIIFMIIAIATFIVIAGFVFVYLKAVQGGYDMYCITHSNEYKQGYNDALHVLEHRADYDEDLTICSGPKLYRLMRNKYGYGELSSRLISYVEFKKIPDKKENVFLRGWKKVYLGVYGVYDKIRNKIASSSWSSAFSSFLFWEPKVFVEKRGYDYIHAVTYGNISRFHHTYDKYNDYLPKLRTINMTLDLLKQPAKLIECAYAEDATSARNGVARIERTNLPKAKEIAPRIVGEFECDYVVAETVAKWVNKALKNQMVNGKDAIETLDGVCADIKAKHDSFVTEFQDKRLSEVHSFVRAYHEYDELISIVPEGKSHFLANLIGNYKMNDEQAAEVYFDYLHASKMETEEEGRAYIAKRAEHAAVYEELSIATPFHPAPLTAKKQLKQFADEKFAVSVLALPTLSCIVVVIIPLVFSVFLAFTNWDATHSYGNFDWANLGFGMLFDTSKSGLAKTFLSLFVWTLVWAFFATFLNYIFGIVVALLINKKEIKGKAFWRTIFVISIAVPQFITLLGMKILLSDTGALNVWLASFTTQKMMGAGTEADPYYLVGDAGFLGWLANIKDSAGRSFVYMTSIKKGTYFKDAAGNVQLLEAAYSYVSSNSCVRFLSDIRFMSTNNDSFAALAIVPKTTIILVNCWIGIPYTMLSTSGILMNIPEDLYESARIDGASPWTQFWKITMPYVLFVTGPSLLTSFIGNINNFNVIYFLTGGGPASGGSLNAASQAQSTDLLITWLYKITVTSDQHQYYLASAIGILIFIICAFFSIIVYRRMGSTKNEEAFQ